MESENPSLGRDSTIPRRWRIVALTALCALYVAGAGPVWNLGIDSSLYLMLAENLEAGRGYTMFGEPHAFVPPGYPLFLAVLMRLGLTSIWALNVASALVGLAALWAAYLLLKQLTSESVAFRLTLLAGAGAIMFRHSLAQLSDVPFMLLVIAGLWCWQRSLSDSRGKDAMLAAGTLLLCASCWFRVVGIPLALVTSCGLVLEGWQRGRTRSLIAATALVLGVCLTGWIFKTAHAAAQTEIPRESYTQAVDRFDLWERSALAFLAQPLVNFYETGHELSRLYSGQEMPPPIALVVWWLPTIVGAGLWWVRGRRMVVAAAVGYVGAILVLRPLLARYLLPVLPLLLLFFTTGLERLLSLRPAWRTRAPQLVTGVVLVLVAMNVPKDVRTIGRMHSGEFPEYRREVEEVAEAVRRHAGPEDRFIGNPDNVISYLSGGVPFVNLVGLYGFEKPEAEEILRVLDEQDVRLVVVFHRHSLQVYEGVLEAAVARHPDYERLFQNSEFELYRRKEGRAIAQQGGSTTGR